MHALVISLGDPPFEVRCLDIGCSASDRRFFAAALRIPSDWPNRPARWLASGPIGHGAYAPRPAVPGDGYLSDPHLSLFRRAVGASFLYKNGSERSRSASAFGRRRDRDGKRHGVRDHVRVGRWRGNGGQILDAVRFEQRAGVLTDPRTRVTVAGCSSPPAQSAMLITPMSLPSGPGRCRSRKCRDRQACPRGSRPG